MISCPGTESVETKKPRTHKFLCLRVGKPMKKTFVSNASASMQQYAQQGKKHEYWFAVPQERSVPPPLDWMHSNTSFYGTLKGKKRKKNVHDIAAYVKNVD